jgi:hypothetical protein
MSTTPLAVMLQSARREGVSVELPLSAVGLAVVVTGLSAPQRRALAREGHVLCFDDRAPPAMLPVPAAVLHTSAPRPAALDAIGLPPRDSKVWLTPYGEVAVERGPANEPSGRQMVSRLTGVEVGQTIVIDALRLTVCARSGGPVDEEALAALGVAFIEADLDAPPRGGAYPPAHSAASRDALPAGFVVIDVEGESGGRRVALSSELLSTATILSLYRQGFVPRDPRNVRDRLYTLDPWLPLKSAAQMSRAEAEVWVKTWGARLPQRVELEALLRSGATSPVTGSEWIEDESGSVFVGAHGVESVSGSEDDLTSRAGMRVALDVGADGEPLYRSGSRSNLPDTTIAPRATMLRPTWERAALAVRGAARGFVGGPDRLPWVVVETADGRALVDCAGRAEPIMVEARHHDAEIVLLDDGEIALVSQRRLDVPARGLSIALPTSANGRTVAVAGTADALFVLGAGRLLRVDGERLLEIVELRDVEGVGREAGFSSLRVLGDTYAFYVSGEEGYGFACGVGSTAWVALRTGNKFGPGETAGPFRVDDGLSVMIGTTLAPLVTSGNRRFPRDGLIRPGWGFKLNDRWLIELVRWRGGAQRGERIFLAPPVPVPANPRGVLDRAPFGLAVDRTRVFFAFDGEVHWTDIGPLLDSAPEDSPDPSRR